MIQNRLDFISVKLQRNLKARNLLFVSKLLFFEPSLFLYQKGGWMSWNMPLMSASIGRGR